MATHKRSAIKKTKTQPSVRSLDARLAWIASRISDLDLRTARQDKDDLDGALDARSFVIGSAAGAVFAFLVAFIGWLA